MAPKIPDRWLNYKAVGNRIDGTRFIAFKVPLKKHFTDDADEDIRFDGQVLLEKVPNLGIIIDLTNTNRYYDPKFFQDEGVEHKKLMIPGHVTPPQRLVNMFKDYVKNFIKSNSDNDKLIGVHCTHGVNRTGFLICNYMVSEMAVDANEAIDKFADARGHKIERHNYLNALKNLSSTTKDNIVNKIPENESIPQEPNTRSTNSRERVSRDNGSISNWRTVKRKPHSPGPSYQDSRNRYSWRNSEDYNDKQPSPSKRMYDGNMNHQRRSNFEYNQQCRRQTYQFQNMEFRGRSEKINNNRNASHHNNSVDRDHRRRPQENSYRQREESSSTHRGASQNDQNSYASRHHTSYKPLPRGDNRNFRRPPSPASTSRERFTDNSYRNRR